MSDYISKINQIPIGGKGFDGQWVFKGINVATTVSIAAKSTGKYSLANIIPNDGYDYEILFYCWNRTDTTNGQYISIDVFSGSNGSTTNSFFVNTGEATVRSGAYKVAEKTGILPISASDRNVTISNTGTSEATVTMVMQAYRRIGTNDTDSSTDYIKYINQKPIGGEFLDGSWVYTTNRNLLAAETLAATTSRQFDISSYLPNDGHDYEVLISGYVRTGTTNGNLTRIFCTSGNVASPGANSHIYGSLAACITRVANSSAEQGTLILPISASDKTITVSNYWGSGATGNLGVYLIGYKRIGTNE